MIRVFRSFSKLIWLWAICVTDLTWQLHRVPAKSRYPWQWIQILIFSYPSHLITISHLPLGRVMHRAGKSIICHQSSSSSHYCSCSSEALWSLLCKAMRAACVLMQDRWMMNDRLMINRWIVDDKKLLQAPVHCQLGQWLALWSYSKNKNARESQGLFCV